jgi:hypothetical protein
VAVALRTGHHIGDASAGSTLDRTTRSVGRRTHHRIAISWTADPTFADYANRPSADIDLQVVDANGRVVASSSSWDDTTEIVEFDSWWAGTYTVRQLPLRALDVPRLGVGHVVGPRSRAGDQRSRTTIERGPTR